jgi:hypothetical protein
MSGSRSGSVKKYKLVDEFVFQSNIKVLMEVFIELSTKLCLLARFHHH